jgi:hypothetical protein
MNPFTSGPQDAGDRAGPSTDRRLNLRLLLVAARVLQEEECRPADPDTVSTATAWLEAGPLNSA